MSKFYKVEEALLALPLTPRAVLLYAILADRQELSRKTGEKYHDKDGYYIIYTITDICTKLHIGERTAKYLLAELEDTGLIRTRKQGKSLPQKIYVRDVSDVSDVQKIAPHDVQKIAPHDVQKIAPHDVQKIAPLISYTDTSSTDTSSSRLPALLAMIDECAAELKQTITDKDRLKLLKKIQKHGKGIHALKPWLLAVMASGSMLENIADDDDSGYQPSYDIAEYESTSVLDEDWDD